MKLNCVMLWQWEEEHMRTLAGINQRVQEVVHQLRYRPPPPTTHVELPE